MSDSVTLPLNLADTGPTLTAMPTAYWSSPKGSKRSQPARQALSVSGSLSASQACCWLTARERLACISMAIPFCDGGGRKRLSGLAPPAAAPGDRPAAAAIPGCVPQAWHGHDDAARPPPGPVGHTRQSAAAG